MGQGNVQPRPGSINDTAIRNTERGGGNFSPEERLNKELKD